MEDSWISLRPKNSVIITNFFKKNFLQLDDNIFGMFNTKQSDYFYQISKKDQFLSDDTYGPGPGIYFYQLFKVDREYDIYERAVYTITGVLRDVGGFYSSMYFVGLFLFSQFAGSIFFAAFINKLYQVEQIKDGADLASEGANSYTSMRSSKIVVADDNFVAGRREGAGDKSGKNGGGASTSSVGRKNSASLNKVFGLKNKSDQQRMQLACQKIREDLVENNCEVDKGLYNVLRTYLSNRWRIELKPSDMMWYSIQRVLCFCCLKRGNPAVRDKNKKADISSTQKRANLYQRGEAKVIKELDCINILTRLRQLDLLVSLFLSNQQKVLLHFSKQNLLRQEDDNYTSSDEELASSEAYQQLIPKFPIAGEGLSLAANHDIEMKMRTADEVMSEAMHSLFLNKTELSSVNKKILFGLLSKKPEKHIRRMSGKKLKDASRTLAGGAGGGTSNQRTPQLLDQSEDPTAFDQGEPLQQHRPFNRDDDDDDHHFNEKKKSNPKISQGGNSNSQQARIPAGRRKI